LHARLKNQLNIAAIYTTAHAHISNYYVLHFLKYLESPWVVFVAFISDLQHQYVALI
jgi:hypothetical protein